MNYTEAVFDNSCQGCLHIPILGQCVDTVLCNTRQDVRLHNCEYTIYFVERDPSRDNEGYIRGYSELGYGEAHAGLRLGTNFNVASKEDRHLHSFDWTGWLPKPMRVCTKGE